MENQFIQWTYAGELKTAKLDLGETCSIAELKKVDAKRFKVKQEEAIDYGKQKAKEETKHKYKEGSAVPCTSCEENKRRNGLINLAKGGAKLLKAHLGIDASDKKTMAERKALCLSCPTYDFGVCVEEKGGCGCFVAAKIKLKSEACPLDKWKAVN